MWWRRASRAERRLLPGEGRGPVLGRTAGPRPSPGSEVGLPRHRRADRYVLRLRPRTDRFELGEIGFGLGQSLETGELIADRGELADEQPRRSAVPVRRPVGIDDDDPSARLQIDPQVPEELARPLDLMVHV